MKYVTNDEDSMESSSTEKKHKVLVVDDEELNVRFLSTFLTRKGFVVDVASRGTEALQQIDRSMPDVVLLDVMMPDMDGFEVCRVLRQNPQTHLLPVVMVTALHSIEDEVRALEVGADDFLPKPINNLELMARLRSLLRIKNLHDELKASKQELEIKNKELIELQGFRDSLTQMIIHDLKNPLTGIMGCTEILMMMNEDLNDRQKTIVKKLDESATTMLKMITDMLDISRMEENKVKLKKQPFSITELFEFSLSEFAFLMQKNQIRGRIETGTDEMMIEADRDMIQRVVSNLLHNAIKHSMKDGEVILKASVDAEQARMYISVKDYGEGIAPEYHEKIFEKFAQADLKKLGLKTDRGLGLTFCKLAVESHGGKIWVESAVSSGSEFKFYLSLQ